MLKNKVLQNFSLFNFSPFSSHYFAKFNEILYNPKTNLFNQKYYMISQKYISQNFAKFRIISSWFAKFVSFLIGSQNLFCYVKVNSPMVLENHLILSRFVQEQFLTKNQKRNLYYRPLLKKFIISKSWPVATTLNIMATMSPPTLRPWKQSRHTRAVQCQSLMPRNCTGNISNMYLWSTLADSEYVCFPVHLIPPNIITHYALQPLIYNNYIYARIKKTWYGLKQSGNIIEN